jgi:hypothetical protein
MNTNSSLSVEFDPVTENPRWADSQGVHVEGKWAGKIGLLGKITRGKLTGPVGEGTGFRTKSTRNRKLFLNFQIFLQNTNQFEFKSGLNFGWFLLIKSNTRAYIITK